MYNSLHLPLGLGVSRVPIARFRDHTGTGSPASSLSIPAGCFNNDLVVAVAGHNDIAGSCLFTDANNGNLLDLSEGDNGTNIQMGASAAFVPDHNFVFTPVSASRHRMRSFAFENASRVEIPGAPTFAASSTNCVFPATAVPSILSGKKTFAVLFAYCTSTHGGIVSTPDGYTAISINGFTPAWISNEPVLYFPGITPTFTNSVFSGKLVGFVA